MEQGLAQELARGRQRIGKQLTLKFGPLTAEQKQRLDQAGFEQLNLWSERLLFADNLDDALSE